jgi:hypothetical protein
MAELDKNPTTLSDSEEGCRISRARTIDGYLDGAVYSKFHGRDADFRHG